MIIAVITDPDQTYPLSELERLFTRKGNSFILAFQARDLLMCCLNTIQNLLYTSVVSVSV